MIKIALKNVSAELNIKEAQELISRMPIEAKTSLFERLKKETWAKRIDLIRASIDKRRRRLKITSKELLQEINEGIKSSHENRR